MDSVRTEDPEYEDPQPQQQNPGQEGDNPYRCNIGGLSLEIRILRKPDQDQGHQAEHEHAQTCRMFAEEPRLELRDRSGRLVESVTPDGGGDGWTGRLAVLVNGATAEGAEALSSLEVGPIGLLAPFVHLGAHNAHPCNIQSVGQEALPAPPAK